MLKKSLMELFNKQWNLEVGALQNCVLSGVPFFKQLSRPHHDHNADDFWLIIKVVSKFIEVVF